MIGGVTLDANTLKIGNISSSVPRSLVVTASRGVSIPPTTTGKKKKVAPFKQWANIATYTKSG